MSATNLKKTAASSTPAAAPPDSQPAGEKPPSAAAGADPEENAAMDGILAEVNRLSDDSSAAAAPDQPDESDEPEKPEAAIAAAGAAGELEEPEKPGAAAEPEPEGAPPGEGAPPDAGAEAEPEKPAAGAETPPEAGEQKSEPAAMQKRFNELTARAKSAEESLAQARERLASYDAAASGKLEPAALDQIDSVETLEVQRKQLAQIQKWALAHPDGGEMPATDLESQPMSYDAEGVRALLAQTSRLLYEAVPARAQFLRAREQSEAQAVTAYPWLKDTRSGPGAQVQALLEATPGVRRLGPNYRLIAADALIGQTLREAGVIVDGKLVERLKGELAKAKAAPSAPALRRTPPPAPGRPGTVPGQMAPREAAARQAAKRLQTDGSEAALTEYIASKLP